jgi:hypothetical protein
MTALTTAALVEKGFLQPLKRGRPRLYPTAEEQAAAKREQQKVCSKRHTERVKAARTLMREQSKMLEEACGVRRTCSLADFQAQAL